MLGGIIHLFLLLSQTSLVFFPEVCREQLMRSPLVADTAAPEIQVLNPIGDFRGRPMIGRSTLTSKEVRSCAFAQAFRRRSPSASGLLR